MSYFIPVGRNLRKCTTCGAPVVYTTDGDGHSVTVEPSPRNAEHGLGGRLVTQQSLKGDAVGQMMDRHECKGKERGNCRPT